MKTPTVTFVLENGISGEETNREEKTRASINNIIWNVYTAHYNGTDIIPNDDPQQVTMISALETANINYCSFYQSEGQKITKVLKTILKRFYTKEYIEKHFAEFCKRISELYLSVEVTATITKPYFNTRTTAIYGKDDYNSCFRAGDFNQCNGELIDTSPSTGVITLVVPETSRYGPGRMIVWIKSDTTAYLFNQYGTKGRSGLPSSVFVRALENLSGTKITYRHETSKPLPIYINSGSVISCTAVEGNFSRLTDKPGILACPVCGYEFPAGTEYATQVGNTLVIACSRECGYEILQGEDDHIDEVECYNCGNTVDVNDVIVVGDDNICSSCYEADYDVCYECEEPYHIDELIETGGLNRERHLVCPSCINRDYEQCSYCEEWFQLGTLTEPCDTSRHYCDTCLVEQTTECAKCGEIYELAQNQEEFSQDGRCRECQDNDGDDNDDDDDDDSSQTIPHSTGFGMTDRKLAEESGQQTLEFNPNHNAAEEPTT